MILVGLGNNRCFTNASKGSRNQEFLIVHKRKAKQLAELNWLDKNQFFQERNHSPLLARPMVFPVMATDLAYALISVF